MKVSKVGRLSQLGLRRAPICALHSPPSKPFHPPPAAQVDLPGGPLLIEWSEADNHVYMTGPAELVFQGSVDV